MLFTELRYLLFFAIIWMVYWVLPWPKARKGLLLAGSYLFYSAWDPRFLLLILLSTGVDYIAGGRIAAAAERTTRKAWLLLSLGVNLGVLFFFKYFNFFTQSLVDLMNQLGVVVSHTTLEIVLPVGISFYTFQTLSYTIEIYRGKLEPRRSLLDFALYVAFFPQLVAGPIVRAKVFLPQVEKLAKLSEVAIRPLLFLFLVGYIKKACVADNLAPYIDQVYSDPSLFTAMAVVGAVLLYSVQIYCDFSGYTDMAIASAGLLGFSLPKNFDFPSLAASATEFWRRWHISLSSWMRDYVYFPLGGNRMGERRSELNLMITMLVGGLWHGAAWGFVIWGGLNALALIIQKRWHSWRSGHRWHLPTPVAYLLGLLLTYWWMSLARIFFRAEDMQRAGEALQIFLTLQSSGQQLLGLAWIPLLLGLGAVHSLFYRWDVSALAGRLSIGWFTLLMGVGSALALSLRPVGYQPFVYFQF
uniref:Probable alginate O-acetylase AlgI n=1 Tax=Magnetococcus massalia (strain MO-1) TaxID=451514 RepID=A0A1S7LJU7_MAGMO|nr:Putative poly(beta-D-mannuronate) O-acetylase. putative membrane bound O-acyl transferase MBOAT family protein. (algI) [Candidatus Magnetococcus massalia]